MSSERRRTKKKNVGKISNGHQGLLAMCEIRAYFPDEYSRGIYQLQRVKEYVLV